MRSLMLSQLRFGHGWTFSLDCLASSKCMFRVVARRKDSHRHRRIFISPRGMLAKTYAALCGLQIAYVSPGRCNVQLCNLGRPYPLEPLESVPGYSTLLVPLEFVQFLEIRHVCTVVSF